MSAELFVVRSEIRHRIGSLLVLAGIVAAVTAVVLAGAAGARRTASVMDRFLDDTDARDIGAVGISSDVTRHPERAVEIGEQLAALPGVERVGTALGFYVDVGTEYDFTVVASPDGSYASDVDRGLLVSGRLPSPDSVDEVVLNEVAVQQLDLGVGDRLRGESFSPRMIARLQEEQLADEPRPDGPSVTLQVVGVVRTGEELSAKDSSANPAGYASPAFYREHGDDVGSIISLYGMQVDRSRTDLATVQDAMRDAFPGGESFASWIEDEYAGEARDAYRVLAVGVAVFSLIAALAGLVAVTQAIARQVGMSLETNVATGMLGMGRRGRLFATALPTVLASVVGVAAGALVAVALSPLFPLSVARRAETGPAISADLTVLAAGGLAVLLVVTVWALFVASRLAAHSVRAAPMRPSRAAAAAARAGAPAPAVVGVRMAYEAGRGRFAVPVRSAIIGAIVGIAGVVGVAVFSATLDDTLAAPARYGWTWTSKPDIAARGAEATVRKMVREEQDLEGIGALSCGPVDVEHHETLYGCALDVLKGPMAFAVADGRLPASAAEIGIASSTMREIGVGIGDTVRAVGGDGNEVVLTVVGAPVMPLVDNQEPGRGVVLTSEGLEVLRQTAGGRYLVLDYDGSVDPTALEARLADEYGLSFNVYSRPEPPGQLDHLESMSGLLVALGAFLAGLGAVGLLHYLAISVRRRRGELAVLRSLGFVRSDVLRAVSWQACAAAAVGVVAGVPLGIVLGRVAWRAAVSDLGMIDPPSTPWIAGGVIALIALAGAAMLGAVSGWFVARRRPAEVLRAE